MITDEEIRKFKDWEFRISAYEMALKIIDIDKQTVAPADGMAYRDERSTYLAGELFSIQTEKDMYDLVKKMKDDTDLDGDLRRAAQLHFRDMENTFCVPKEDYVAYQHLCAESYGVWLKAKKADSYEMFAPYLTRIIEMKKKLYGYRNSSLPIYDQMLDDYEPGMNTAKYDAFFAEVKERLVPLIQKVVRAEPIRTDFLCADYPEEGQKKFTKSLLKYLHFDPSWGYQNETEHPFTDWTCAGDCRTTTKYLTDNVASAILSTVHETGHAWYRHNVDRKYDGTILAEGISCGMHESQSRLCENYLGRSEAFWDYNFPALQAVFPEQLKGVDAKMFTRAINASAPSLVRTEADELTYPMHIAVRYEIEKGLFNGTISTDRLDETWNAMYDRYLGIHAEKASEGILQDVHWACGDIGYFPTYALGSAFAAQFMHKMREDMDVDEALRSGHYEDCIGWLREHIHKYGARYDAEEVMKLATGETFDPHYYLDYLEQKYTELYHL